jgi:hypothetical protein
MGREKRVQIRCPVGSEDDFWVPKKLRVNEEYSRETFNLFDRRRVGYFTDKDINRLFSTSKEQLKEFTDRFDENRDGKIEWDEFMGTMTEFVDEKGDLNFWERYCEPQSNPIFFWVEFVCIMVFTVEYGIKLCTCGASRFGSEFELILDVVTVPKEVDYVVLNRIYNFVTNTMNVIDLLAIIPFYMSEVPVWMMGKIYFIDWCGTEVKPLIGGEGLNISFLRVLRLMRVFRVFKMGKYSQGMQLFSKVMLNSLPALKLLCFFTLLGMILFGSMIYIFEKGFWMSTTTYPDGAYMRQDVYNKDLDLSPFTSIPSCFWWVIVTQTTVGYGDSFPTTELGKVVGSFCMISGVLVLALPITIIGANFANEYAKVQAEEARERHQMAAAQAKLEADEARRKRKLAKQGIVEAPAKKPGLFGPFGRMLSSGKASPKTTPPGVGAEIAPEIGGNAKDGGWTAGGETAVVASGDGPSSPVMSVDAGSDSDEDDISDIDLIKEHMGNVGGELIGLIRDYIDADRITKIGGDQMLFEINELMKLLNQKELTVIPLDMVHGMLAIAWHWIKKCESDDTVVLLPAHKVKILKMFWDFASSTQRCPD